MNYACNSDFVVITYKLVVRSVPCSCVLCLNASCTQNEIDITTLEGQRGKIKSTNDSAIRNKPVNICQSAIGYNAIFCNIRIC